MATSLTGFTGVRPPQTGKVAGYDVQNVAQYNPEQMQLFQQQFQHVSPDSYLSRLAGGDQDLFNEMEAPAIKQFSGIQGNLASRFSGAGGFGGRQSSGFRNSANQAGTDFASLLQSNRQNLQRQALQDLSSMSQQLLSNRPYQTFGSTPESSFLEKLLKGGSGLLGAGVGGFFGGLPGATLGSQLGSSFAEGF